MLFALLRCNKQVVAVKTMKVVQSPPVLSLHLKRFSPFGKKLTQPIAFDDRLVLANPIYEGAPIEYELYGVTLHYGSGPNNGHYISIVKNAKKQWCKMDDSDVSGQSKLSNDDKRNTYQLHYIRKSGDRLAEAISHTSKAQVASPAKQGRPDLGRSYGAVGNGSEPGTSQSHARQAQAEQAQAEKQRLQVENRGSKRQRDEGQDQGVPVDAQSKKPRAGNPKFQPIREGFYGTPEKKSMVSPEDPDATDEEDGAWADEQTEGQNGGGAGPSDDAPNGSWDGGYQVKSKVDRSPRPPLQARSSQGSSGYGSKDGKKTRRGKHKASTGSGSPFLASLQGQGHKKRRGHGAMRPKNG